MLQYIFDETLSQPKDNIDHIYKYDINLPIYLAISSFILALIHSFIYLFKRRFHSQNSSFYAL